MKKFFTHTVHSNNVDEMNQTYTNLMLITNEGT